MHGENLKFTTLLCLSSSHTLKTNVEDAFKTYIKDALRTNIKEL